MKLTNRLKFILGIISTLLLAGVLFLYLDYSMSRVDSIDAQLQADTFTVGVDYSGVVEKQYIQEGDIIKKGDPLFEIRSSTLADAIKNNDIAKSSLLYSLTDEGKILLTASADGRVQVINYRAGAFVPANSEIAIVNIENSLYVSASYELSSPDYARISRDSKMTVTLPDNTKIEATIYDITLATENKEVVTTVKARLNQDAINKIAFSVGTPVKTTLYLDTDTWYNRISKSVHKLLQPGA